MLEGIQTLHSSHSVDEVVARLQSLIHEKGVKLFAVIDHSGEAAKIDEHMPNTKVVIFGSPKAGTPLMVDAPSLALDLPLKILVAENHDGSSTLSWNDPTWLQQRHGFPKELTAKLAAVELLAKLATQ
jgi:uncharacterized protein (DUF302 family)